MGGPHATAAPHAAVGDAAPYYNEWEFREPYSEEGHSVEQMLSAPSVLPGAAGVEHWKFVPYDDLSDVWRNSYQGHCWYVYSNVTLCKAVDNW